MSKLNRSASDNGISGYPLLNRAQDVIGPGAVALVMAVTLLVGPALAKYDLTLVNASEAQLTDHVVVIQLGKFPEEYRRQDLRVVDRQGDLLPAQLDDMDGDGTPDELIVELTIPARGTKRVTLQKGAAYSAEATVNARIKNPSTTIVTNRLLSVKEPRGDMGGGYGTVTDRATGQTFLNAAVAISDNYDGRRAQARLRVISDGPLRAVTEKAAKVEADGHPYLIRARHLIYRNRRGFDVQWVFKNLGNKQAPPPRMHLKGKNAGGVRGDDAEGTLLMPAETDSWEFVTPPWGQSDQGRFHKLIISQNTGYGFGLISNTVKGFDGMFFADSGSKAGKLLLGGSFAKYGKSTIHTSAKQWIIGPGQTDGLTLSFRFYKGPRQEIREKYLKHVAAAGGAVTVLGENDSILQIASTPPYVIEDFETKDRWLTDDKVSASVQDGRITVRSPQPNRGIFIPLTRNFVESTELRARIDGLSPRTAVRASLVDVETGKKHALATWKEAGRFNVDVVRTVQDWYYHLAWHEKKTMWRFKKRKYGNHKYSVEGEEPEPYYRVPLRGVRKLLLRLELVSRKTESGKTGKRPLEAVIDRVALESPMSPPPVITSPYDNVSLADVALTFYLLAPEGEWNISRYEIQFSRHDDFDPLCKSFSPRVTHTGKMWTKKASNFYQSFTPRELPEPGRYYWRARSLSMAGVPGDWSPTRSLRIESADREAEDHVRRIDARNPGFIVRGAAGKPMQQMSEQVRQHLLRHHGITPIPTADRLDRLMSAARQHSAEEILERDDLRKRLGGWQPFPPKLVKFHKQANLGMMDYIFRKHSDYALGITFGEKGIDEPHFQRALLLASMHGRYATQLGGQMYGTSGRAAGTYEAVKKRSKYFLPIIKTNNPNAPFAKALCAMGSYMAGRCDGWGAETEWGSAYKGLGYRWERAYKPQVKTRPLDWMPSLIMGLAGGATVYRVETAVGKSTTVWNADEEKLGTLWTHALGPFINDILDEDLIPTRDELRETVQVAIDSKIEYGNSRFKAGGAFPARIVGRLNGIDVEGKERADVFQTQWVPDGAPFGIVPVLPLDRTEQEYDRFQKVVEAERFSSPEEAVKYFEQYYPEDDSEAWAHLIGDTGIVINSYDWRQNSRPQSYKLPLTKGPVKTVEGDVSFREYLLMKQRPEELFLHTNDYTVRYTEMILHSRDGGRLKVETKPASALTQAEWRDGKLHVVLNHAEGVSRLTVTSE